MMENFVLDLGIRIETEYNTPAIARGINRMKRDLWMTLEERSVSSRRLDLKFKELPNEIFHLTFTEDDTMIIEAGDELGFLYGLHYISETYLGITPFWFWNDQIFMKKKEVMIPKKEYISSAPLVPYRGWFINDEVLIDKWTIDGDDTLSWEMAFEALLRCKGNMVIPGTDHNSKKFRNLAIEYGLWITHHHAEPLGAEMFARKYPNLKASYSEHPDLFKELWKEGIKEQKDRKVIWNLGFRGQGDCPFWESDDKYQTDEARGELISSVIKLQYELVKKEIPGAVCCTNLYGEIMELYQKGYILLPQEIIKIWADNGYGKMVSRRHGNENPRVYALPKPENDVNREGHHGIYYHVSFYDLQAANHITMLPNSLEFVRSELIHAFSQGAEDYLIVNCSNIKPHVFYLDAIRQLWCEKNLQVEEQISSYVKKYYLNNYMSTNLTQKKDEHTYLSILEDRLGNCFRKYAESTVAFGIHEDEHAGEQFYNYSTRILTSHWLKGDILSPAKEFLWATGNIMFKEQMNWFYKVCGDSRDKFIKLYEECMEVAKELEGFSKQLLEDSILLQIKIHLHCLEGSISFCESFSAFVLDDYQKAFYLCAKARESFYNANQCMRDAEHDKWIGFYANECLCDIKQTAYVLKFLMGYIRNYGEGPHFYQWQREFLYKEEDKRVVLLTNIENHLTDEELVKAMEKRYRNIED